MMDVKADEPNDGSTACPTGDRWMNPTGYQIIRSRYYCCSSIRLVSINENKNTVLERLP